MNYKRIHQNKQIRKSIELGFNGKLTTDFYLKWHTSKKVRQKIYFELIVTFLFLFLSFYCIYFINLKLDINIVLLFFYFLFILIFMFRNIYIIYDIHRIKKQRFIEYAKQNNIML